MLYQTLEPALLRYVKNRQTEIFPSEAPFTLHFLAQGEYNINYVLEQEGKKQVLRVNTASQIRQANQIKYEYDALQLLKDSGVTPKPLYLDDSKAEIPYGLLTMEFVPGRPLWYATDLSRAARIFGQIHSLPVPRNHPLLTEERLFSARIDEAQLLLSDVWDSRAVSLPVKQFFSRFMDWAEAHRNGERYFLANRHFVINNTEVNSSNFILGARDVLIDWEKPVVSDPAQDITQFLSPTTTLWKTDTVLSEEQKLAFFAAYKQALGLLDFAIEERVRLYLPYLYLRALSWCAHAWVTYHTPGRAIVNEDTREKIRQYLAIDQLKNWLRPYFTI